VARQPQNVLFRLPPADLDAIVTLARRDLETLCGRRLLLTGGTGFFGKWITGALLYASARLDLGLELTLLSRDPAQFQRAHPEVKDVPGLGWVHGDILHAVFPEGRFDSVIHAAADTAIAASPEEESARSMTILTGMTRMIDFAQRAGATRLLNISSGAVYGAAVGQPGGAREEDFAAAVPLTPYGQAKHKAELLPASLGAQDLVVTARAFAFVGPHLPLDAHFAAGNFIRDALRGGPIQVRGDGTAVRSYLYPVDLVVWLLALLVRAPAGLACNVGSDEAVTTAELARLAANAVQPPVEVTVQDQQPHGPQNIYLPDVTRARRELGLEITVPLREAIARTVAWHRADEVV
jgi:dTDP-glucose 4,6-dehydratase